MKVVVRPIIAVTLLHFSVSALLPKTGYAQDGCDAFVTSGLRQSTESFQSSEWSLLFLARLTKMTHEQARQELHRHGGKVGYGPLSVEPGTYDAGKHRELTTELSRLVSIDEVLKNQKSLIINSGDPILADAYLKCREMGGFLFQLERNGLDHASLAVRWKPYPTAPDVDPILSEDISVINGDITSGRTHAVKGANLGINLPRHITIRRHDPKKELIVAMNTENAGGSTAYLPPSLIEVPPKSCATYQNEHPDVATCSTNTDDGYYWKVIYPRLEIYGINAVPSGAHPRCSKAEADSGNVIAYTVRYPPAHRDGFVGVREQWTITPPPNPGHCNTTGGGDPVPEFAGRDVGPICGRFKVLCSRQE